MDVLGHTTAAMVVRYQHAVDDLGWDAAGWDAADTIDGVFGDAPGVIRGVNTKAPDAGPGPSGGGAYRSRTYDLLRVEQAL
jgi:hypothetical protein